MTGVLIGTSHTLDAYNHIRLDYKLVDAGKVYLGIHKVKVRPATGVHLPLKENH